MSTLTILQTRSLPGLLLGLVGVLAILAGLRLLLRSLRHTRGHAPALAWLHIDVDQPHYIERLIYRHHRTAGILLTAAAAMWLWLLSPLDEWRAFLLLTWHYFKRVLGSADFPVLAGSWLALTVLIIGLLLLVRPSLLKPLETAANRWIDPFASDKAQAPSAPMLQQTRLAAGLSGGLALLAAGGVLLWLALH